MSEFINGKPPALKIVQRAVDGIQFTAKYGEKVKIDDKDVELDSLKVAVDSYNKINESKKKPLEIQNDLTKRIV